MKNKKKKQLFQRIKKQEDNIREKIEKIHINTKKDFNLINNNNIDDINKFKELQFKLIEVEKEKRIKECYEKYKNIMEKLSSMENEKNEQEKFNLKCQTLLSITLKDLKIDPINVSEKQLELAKKYSRCECYETSFIEAG